MRTFDKLLTIAFLASIVVFAGSAAPMKGNEIPFNDPRMSLVLLHSSACKGQTDECPAFECAGVMNPSDASKGPVPFHLIYSDDPDQGAKIEDKLNGRIYLDTEHNGILSGVASFEQPDVYDRQTKDPESHAYLQGQYLAVLGILRDCAINKFSTSI